MFAAWLIDGHAEIFGEAQLVRPFAGEHMVTILIIVLVLLLIGALPSWPHSRGWGYYPSGGLGLIVLIVIILLLMGRI